MPSVSSCVSFERANLSNHKKSPCWSGDWPRAVNHFGARREKYTSSLISLRIYSNNPPRSTVLNTRFMPPAQHNIGRYTYKPNAKNRPAAAAFPCVPLNAPVEARTFLFMRPCTLPSHSNAPWPPLLLPLRTPDASIS